MKWETNFPGLKSLCNGEQRFLAIVIKRESSSNLYYDLIFTQLTRIIYGKERKVGVIYADNTIPIISTYYMITNYLFADNKMVNVI